MTRHRTAGLNQLGPRRSKLPFVSHPARGKPKALGISKEDVDGINAWRTRHGIALLGQRSKKPAMLKCFKRSRKPVTLPKVTKYEPIDGNG